MLTELLITFIKMCIFNICSSYAFLKIKNINVCKNKIVQTIMLNILLSSIYAIIYSEFELQNYDVATINLVCYIIYSFAFSKIVDNNVIENTIVTTVSITIAYVSLLIASIVSFMVLRILLLDFTKDSIFEYIFIGSVQFLLIYSLFKIKRLKNGFSFLKSERERYTKTGMIISAILIAVAVITGKDTDNIALFTVCNVTIIIGGILMLYWIKKSITKYYKEKMKDRTVEIQQEQIKEKDKKIDDLQTELSKVLEINHKYNHRLSAMERAVIKLGNEMQANTEFAEEYGDILDSLNELSKEYKAEVESINKTNKLPKTNIFSIDNLLDYMRQEAEKSKIEFKLEIEFDIKEIIENKIPKNKLETLLTDHIRDAIIAIENSENKNRKIEVKFSNKEFYQVEFYDTGIEFEIETLLNIGLERTTTHKATGGTGIGFMTTFETLKECKASLEIEEFNNKEYTKAVIIGFDGKNEYRIHSYRAEEIKNKIQDNRIIID